MTLGQCVDVFDLLKMFQDFFDFSYNRQNNFTFKLNTKRQID